MAWQRAAIGGLIFLVVFGATAASTNVTFNAAGQFTVRLQATATRTLAASGNDDFRNYESSHVHPVALSAAGDALYALNTPDARLAFFDVAGDGGLTFAGDVPVGLDPVSLAVRPGSNEIWVVNHLSDSVSVVDASTRKVVATIAVGDEPTDVAFASTRAFVTLAGNQDRVKVYNAATRVLIATLDLFGDDPRALATSADGSGVYAVVMSSGNQTTVVSDFITQGNLPAPNPPRAPGLGEAPDVGIIVKRNPSNGRWEDETGGNWSSVVTYTLPDNDVFVIDADAATPALIRTISRLGTTLFDVAVHPATGQLWVSNTEARNVTRFEPNPRRPAVAPPRPAARSPARSRSSTRRSMHRSPATRATRFPPGRRPTSSAAWACSART